MTAVRDATELNEALSRRSFAEQDRVKGGPPDTLCAPEYRVSFAGGPPMDLAGHHQFAAMFYAAFPDIYHTIDDAVAMGDRVAVRFTLRGTHLGNFMGIAPTGRRITVSATAFDRIANGRIAERWAQFDAHGLLQQLGAIPTPG